MRQAGGRGCRGWQRSKVHVLGARAAQCWCAKYRPACTKGSGRAQVTASARAQAAASARAQAATSARAQAAASAQPEEQCAAESAGSRETACSASHPGLELCAAHRLTLPAVLCSLGQALHAVPLLVRNILCHGGKGGATGPAQGRASLPSVRGALFVHPEGQVALKAQRLRQPSAGLVMGVVPLAQRWLYQC